MELGEEFGKYGGVDRYIYMVWVGKPEVKTAFGRTRRRWLYNIKIQCEHKVLP